MGKFQDLTGQKFGRLTVIERAENKKKQTAWLCRCDCGNECVVIAYSLKSGNTSSCGCYRKENLIERITKHGKTHDRLFSIWQGMKNRCYNKNTAHYKDYGGRGIIICDEWLHDFQAFYNWAITHGYKENLEIDRINNDENYCPENCKWATRKEQNSNKRNNRMITYNGNTMTLKQWAEKSGINYYTLRARIDRGNWTLEKALSTP